HHVRRRWRGQAPASAVTTREGEGRPSCSAIQTLVSTRAERSTPVSTPAPSSAQTRSSVARLPVALLANGHPPSPPADESTTVTPSASAAKVLVSAWP